MVGLDRKIPIYLSSVICLETHYHRGRNKIKRAEYPSQDSRDLSAL